MDKSFIPIRLREARNMCGYSLDQFVKAADVCVTRQSIYNYERGVMQPKPEMVKMFADTLGVSEHYFYGNSTKIDIPMLRTTGDDLLSEEELQHFEVMLSYWAERYLLMEKKVGIKSDFSNPLADITVSTLDDVILAADRLREVWRCGSGPLPAVLRLMERKGIKILSTELPDGILGLSTFADESHPLIVVDMRPQKTTIERLRFTACHELAHILLHFSDDCNVEKMCNKFANFFLFPKQAFIEEMGAEHRNQLSLKEMIDLKELYGISIAAQVHAAWDLRMISREHYDWWYDEMIKKNRLEEGWGIYSFPETIGREKRVEARMKTNARED
ncbi:XRE family transcriptional regulator [Prevotella sp.]|uniref:XRE family transcriptional regulator n=1 Tax=Prevotella sp. TaxID=59823 RepID=UPI002E795FFE|nr:XRE family transcriptional regulator [Prevotella sp.]MEE0670673.1 XRE family transcriptional regulator [Prevotella sp.]